MNSAPYLLAIGDIVTDAFIQLREDQATVTTEETGLQRLSMEFGTKLPYDHVEVVPAVGNSANAAVSFSRLGLRGGLMAPIGGDDAGKDMMHYLKGEKVDTSTMNVFKDMKSNYHYVLRYGADRTILIKYEDYEYRWQTPSEEPDWLYLSAMSKNSWELHEQMMAYLSERPNVKLAFQPGTFHFEWGAQKLRDIYARSYIVFMNREEAAIVTEQSTKSVPDLVNALHALGPDFVVVTDGAAGAYASDGTKIEMMPNYPDPAPPNDRTGAGDAFASTFVAALALGESIETALRWAPINSMNVVQHIGAQKGLLGRDEIEKYLAQAPEHYQPKIVEE